MDKTKIWIIGAAIVMVGVLALGWFVGVEPQLKAATSTDMQRNAVATQNEITENAIEKLKGDYASIDALRTELAGLRESIPAGTEMPVFLSQLDGLVAQSGTVLTSLIVADGIPYTAPESQKAPPPTEVPADGQESTTDAESSPAPEAEAPAAPVLPDIVTNERITSQNFVAVPITVQVTGPYANALDFVEKLQHGTRLFLVTRLQSEPNSTDETLVDATVSGYVYVLLAS